MTLGYFVSAYQTKWAFKGDTKYRRKRSRVTGANMVISEKLEPLLTGESKKSLYFSNVKQLPYHMKLKEKHG